ncbi:MAG: YggS family pyridoxal phosphate-dependent enzyme [Halanaerobiales bacterium]
MKIDRDKLNKRWKNVKKNIKTSAQKARRDPNEIKLVAVSKNHPVEKIEYFKKQGIKLFGENRVQELRKKNNMARENITWHFVGHLQRNKVKHLTRMKNCVMIESVDSLRLAEEINKRSKKNNRVMPVLVEVNISRDENKYGINPEESIEFIEQAKNDFDNLEIKGLMTILPYVEDPEELRPYFRQMSSLKEKANNKNLDLTELSMGMTNDYQIAIEEGATIVRIGTALFGKRKY